MNHRPPLRAALDRLTQTFVEGVLRALQSASLVEIQELGSSELGRLRTAARLPRTASRVAAPAPAREVAARASGRDATPRVRSSRASASRANEWRSIPDHEESDPNLSVTITDPAAVLAMVEDVIRSAPAIAAATLIASAEEEDEPAPPEPPPSVAPASRVELRPAARPGEEVLRAAGGALVLRRRRPQATAQRS